MGTVLLVHDFRKLSDAVLENVLKEIRGYLPPFSETNTEECDFESMVGSIRSHRPFFLVFLCRDRRRLIAGLTLLAGIPIARDLPSHVIESDLYCLTDESMQDDEMTQENSEDDELFDAFFNLLGDERK